MKRIMAGVIILFFMLSHPAWSQCRQNFILDQTVTTEGVNNGVDHYYQNLIIQDIALANRQAFSDISLRFDYKIQYVTDQCRPGNLEIRVLPVEMKCSPLLYYGYDISSAVKPEKADLIFHLVQHEGFVIDSLIFYDIPLEKDSSLYSSQTSEINDIASGITVAFSRAIFHYTKSSYERFRDRILQIDQYYAASMIADSARKWVADGMLAETGSKAEMILRQVELERIIDYIRPEKFDAAFLPGHYDLDGLASRYQELQRLDNRYKAIINYNRFETKALGNIIIEKDLLGSFLDRFDRYYLLAFKSDFRFVNFIEGLSIPGFTNSGLWAFHELINRHYKVTPFMSRSWCRILAQGFIDRGEGFEQTGNQLRALTYYKSAYNISRLMNLHDYQSDAFQLVGRMKDSISSSYLEISRKSALTENPAMAAQYFRDAQDLFADKEFISFEPASIHEYEIWLFLNFENQAVKYIELKNYNKALNYLNEIQLHCITVSSYPCPDQFHDWMRTVRAGIYLELLNKAQNLLLKDEFEDAELAYRQAVGMRLRAGYRIDKDASEEKLEAGFRQLYYDEQLEEGLRYFNNEEFSSALYYFNKADFLENYSLLRPSPDLVFYRQAASRQVMLQLLSDGRIKVWAYDFEGAGSIVNIVQLMLPAYGIAGNDSLTSQFIALKESVLRGECELVFREYNELMSLADSARAANDFILAYEKVNSAVALSMDNLKCKIQDNEAWYQKVLLESPADFQKMEKELDALVSASYSDYLKSFQDLKNYYNRNKLLEQGVVFTPLFDRVLQAKDSAFLTGMLKHYIRQKDFEHAFRLLERLHETGLPSRLLSDEQKTIAEYMARRDAKNSAVSDPWKTLDSYTGRDKWYRSFSWKYKLAWLKETGWKLKYWPFIWKK